MKGPSVVRVLCSIFIALLAAGCTATHGPESADTATSWLRACVGDGECTGASQCVSHLCSISCEEGRDSCAAMARDASCEQPSGTSQSLCDLRCDGDDACAALGVDYTCQLGFCRPGSAIELASQPLTLMDPAPGTDVWPGFDPLATWTGDRFRVAISGGSPEQQHPISVLEAFELFPDGTLVSQGQLAAKTSIPEGAIFTSARPMAINGAGTIVMGVWTQRAEGDAFAVLQFLSPDGHEPRTLECQGMAEVAPAFQGDDWLVLCNDDNGSATLGRYDPIAERWSSPLNPVSLGMRPGEIVRMSVQGEDALLWHHSETWQTSDQPGRIARIHGAAAGGAAQLTDQPLAWHVLEEESVRASDTGQFSPQGLNGDWLVPSWVGLELGPNNEVWNTSPTPMQSPVGFRVRDIGAPSKPVHFPLSVANETRLHAVLGLPERGQVAFCFEDLSLNAQKQTRGELFVSVFDERGNRTGGPHRLSEIGNNNSCRLAWSGSLLLALWFENPGVVEGPMAARARLFSVR